MREVLSSVFCRVCRTLEGLDQAFGVETGAGKVALSKLWAGERATEGNEIDMLEEMAGESLYDNREDLGTG